MVEAGSSDPAEAMQRAGRLAISWLDFKLGLRMLVRYPGLTLVGGIGLAAGASPARVDSSRAPGPVGGSWDTSR